MVTFKDEALSAEDSYVVVQKSTDKKFKNSRRCHSNDKKSLKKRRISAAALGDVENRKVSIKSFYSLDMDALDKTRQYFDACNQNNLHAVENLLLRDSSLAQEKDGCGLSGFHFAAKNSCKPISKLLHSYGADINCTNENGDTPLQVAVEFGTEEIVAFLISLDASATVANKKTIFPLLKAVLLNKPNMVAVLLSNPGKVNINQVDKSNYSALHWAAQLDHFECASILVQCGCNVGALCNLKYTALHWAAKCSASRALEAMLQYEEARRCLEIPDRELNTALHLAVDSGQLESVVICLKYRAKVDARQDHGSTALHLAASQGHLLIVRALLEMQAESSDEPEAMDILLMKDFSGMIPLHRAAMFDHWDVVRYLVEKRRDILYQLNNENKNPLIAAAVRGASESFKILLNAASDFGQRDICGRNVLHHLVTYANFDADTPAILQKICGSCDVELLNQKDIFGCTPLHSATKQGSIKFTEALVGMGAALNSKDLEYQSPLHFAARNGRLRTVRHLLAISSGQSIINESDSNGKTPVMLACENGHPEVMKLLLQRGAMINRDFTDRSVVHLAAVNGHLDALTELLIFHPNLLDQKCRRGFTALHYAAATNQHKIVEFLLSREAGYFRDNEGKTPLNIAIDRKAKESAIAMIKHERWREIMSACNSRESSPMIMLIKYLPDVAQQKFDFGYIADFNGETRIGDQDQAKHLSTSESALYTLNTMVKCGRVKLLTHPLTMNYLSHKWFTYGIWIFLFNIISYLCFAILFTHGILLWHQQMRNNSFNYTIEIQGEPPPINLTVYCRITLILLFTFSLVCILKELFQMYCNGRSYFSDLVNYVEWGLYLSAIIFCSPLFSPNPMARFNWPMGSLALFLTWFNILFFLHRLDRVGIYIIMFRQVLGTIVKVLCVFSVLFIAFGLAFYLLMWHKESDSFSTPFSSILQSVMFTMGEFEFSENFINPYVNGRLIYRNYTCVFLIVFVVLSSLLLVNLLIGLSIDDIKEIQRNATLKRLTMQVDYHTDIEKRLPKSYLHRLNVSSRFLVVYPNRCGKRFIPSVQSIFGRKYELIKRSFEISANNDDQMTETVEKKLEKKLLHMQNQMDNVQRLLTLISQKMNIADDSFDRSAMNAREKGTIVDGK